MWSKCMMHPHSLIISLAPTPFTSLIFLHPLHLVALSCDQQTSISCLLSMHMPDMPVPFASPALISMASLLPVPIHHTSPYLHSAPGAKTIRIQRQREWERGEDQSHTRCNSWGRSCRSNMRTMSILYMYHYSLAVSLAFTPALFISLSHIHVYTFHLIPSPSCPNLHLHWVPCLLSLGEHMM